ncbi:MAG: hypothetical protein II563_10620 [Treponema sp.]|nr:hypothetical protein [Treponema sp.]MBQ2553282.1 hypothetical protein [Treponema sp.]
MKCIKKIALVFVAAFIGVSAWSQDKLGDYLSRIYDLNYQRALIQNEYETAFQEANSILNAEMQKEFQKISQMEQYGWESADEYNARVTEEIEAVSAKRKEAIAKTDAEIRSKFDDQLSAIAKKKQALIDELVAKEFIYSGDSLSLSFSAFNRTQKNFPFTVKSKESDLTYTSRGLHYALNKDNLAEEWPVFDGYIKDNVLSAQVNFIVVKTADSTSYQKKVTQVKLVDGNGTIIATYDVNEPVEIVSMDEAVEAAEKTPVDDEEEAAEAPAEEDEVDEAAVEEEEAEEEEEEDIEEPEEE